MAIKTIFITARGLGIFKIPSDFKSLVSVEAIGGGGGGRNNVSGNGGGGGGAYAKSTTMTGLSAGLNVYYQVGVGGSASNTVSNSWFSLTNSAPTSSSSGANGVKAANGATATSTTGGAGGTVANSTGDLRYAGGNGGNSNTTMSGGGGGAGGPGGNGGNGGEGGGSTVNAGGGSGATLTAAGTAGASTAAGGAGGASADQTGGAAGSPGGAGANGGGGGGGNFGASGGSGGAGIFWSQTNGSARAGSGGGGGGGIQDSHGVGGLYGGGGGGGGSGANGIIVFTYQNTPATLVEKTLFLRPPNGNVNTFSIPNDFVSLVSVEAIGGGGAGGGGGGAGGGAYAKSTSVTGLTPAKNVQFSAGLTAGDSWFNVNSNNTAPTLASQGVLAKGGTSSSNNPAVAGIGGSAASCVGDVKYSGGNGNLNGGGGGAAGPWGAGGDGAVGGGGANGGSAASGTTGGNNYSGFGGGVDGGGNATAGTDGGGGGGKVSGDNGGAGGAGLYWTATNGQIAGPGGGGGGGSAAGLGGLYGGGTGKGSNGTTGGQGIVVFTYLALDRKSGYKFPILNYDGSPSDTIVDLDDMMVRKELFLDAGLWGWGANSTDGVSSRAGMIGDGTTVNKSSPVQIGSLTNWKQVAENQRFSLAVKTDGSLWAWGGLTAGTAGSLGDGTTTSKSSPVQVGSLYDWSYVTNDTNEVSTSFAIKTNGTLWAWGFSDTTIGALGIGDGTNRSSPVQVGSLANWKQVSSHNRTVLAVKTDGTLWAWGDNTNGTLGDGTTVNKSSPVQVGSLTNWKQVSSGHPSLAIKTDGTLWAWGNNTAGNLGDGTTVNKSSPIQIGSLTNWKQITRGLAIKNDGTLWAWGDNTSGRLGDGTTVNKSSPIQIGSLTNWKYVTNNGSRDVSTATQTMSLKTDGTLWGWGNNATGNLGDGTTVNKSSPIQIGLLTNWRQVSGSHAIQSPDLP